MVYKRAVKRFFKGKSPLYAFLKRTREARYIGAQMKRVARLAEIALSKAEYFQNENTRLISASQKYSDQIARHRAADPVHVSRLECLVRQQKSGMAQLRREYRHLLASVRKRINETLSTYIAETHNPKDLTLVVNHAGFITSQTPAAKRVFGDLRKKRIASFVYGSDSEKDKVLDHFEQGAEGWIWADRKGKKVPAKVIVTPLYFKPEDSNEEIPHSTIIRVPHFGRGVRTVSKILSGREKCYQDTLILETEKSRRAEELARAVREHPEPEGTQPA